MTLNKADVANYWFKVSRRKNSCWGWIGSTRKDGYGVLRISVGQKSKLMLAHRIGWVLSGGSWDDRLRNNCKDRACQNPEHWSTTAKISGSFTVTMRSETARAHNLRGEDHPNAVLTAAKVRMIRRKIASGQSVSSISRDTGIKISTVRSVKQRRTWAQVE